MQCISHRIGQNLRRIRKAQSLSQGEIGHVLGVTYQQIQKYETGQSRLSAQALYVLKHFYDVAYEAFFEETGAES